MPLLATRGGGSVQSFGRHSTTSAPTYIEDVFSTYTYTGNGTDQTINNDINLVGNQTAVALNVKSKFASTPYTGNSSVQTITNGIDLSGQGGLVWLKRRGNIDNSILTDSVRGFGSTAPILSTAETSASGTVGTTNISTQSTGFTLTGSGGSFNFQSETYAAWTFRKASKFFDVVTYTGTGSGPTSVPHSLGAIPGFVIIKSINRVGNWVTIARQANGNFALYTSSTNGLQSSGASNNTAADAIGTGALTTTTFNPSWFNSNSTPGAVENIIDNGVNFVAYLFAHDTASDSMIQCGSFTTDGSGNATVTVGWRPQFLLTKWEDASSAWIMLDSARGWTAVQNKELYTNGSAAEQTGLIKYVPTSTGFTVSGVSVGTYNYMVIRTDQEFDGSSGGLVWTKNRNAITNHYLFDTARGGFSALSSSTTGAQSTSSNSGVVFKQTGFDLAGSGFGQNDNNNIYASWTFRKQPKFFDVVTYTGDGTNSRQIAHNLQSTPACAIVKRIDAVEEWRVVHYSPANGYTSQLVLNSTGAGSNGVSGSNPIGNSSTFTVGTGQYIDRNTNGGTYVAYLFAHNAGGFGQSGTENVISCGSWSAGGNDTINLGYEPQWLLLRSASSADDWQLFDNIRGLIETVGASKPVLYLNSTLNEDNLAGIGITSTGFKSTKITGNYIYIAIRRGLMRTPTSGTSVYENVAYTGNGTTQRKIGTSVLMDMMILSDRDGTSSSWAATPYAHYFADRLRGDNYTLSSSSTSNEVGGWNTYLDLDLPTGWDTAIATQVYFNNSGTRYVSHIFKRAAGFFDVVCYTGTPGVVNHSLAAIPELVIFKARNLGATSWKVFHKDVLNVGHLNDTVAFSTYSGFNSFSFASATSTTITLSNPINEINGGYSYVAYLFASCPGVSKVGSYTGNGGSDDTNGTSQTINCGFTNGIRFVLIKRTDSTGSWYVFDSASGIVAGSDPYVLLNNGTAEVASIDAIDPVSSGFIVNQVAGINLNVTGATYIYLAIA